MIFFDEIQDFPEIATSFKSFAQLGKYDVISSGSLLGIQLKRIESISVGYQETAVMSSLDFEEFLWARGYSQEQLDELYGRLVAGQAFAEALVKSGATLAYYKKDNSTLEMDFFLRSGDRLVPVEVKAGNTKAKSMRVLIDSPHYKDISWGIKLVKGDVGFSNGVLTIPHWCAFFLRRLAKEAKPPA